jgi:prepilin-type N-terminal cleavage/methylation domain-containing protein
MSAIKIETRQIPYTARRGMTLIEVLVALGICGLIATMALGPLMFVVNRTVSVPRTFAAEEASHRALRNIAFDARQTLPGTGPALRISRRDTSGTRRDLVLFRSVAPTVRGTAAGTVAYTVDERGLLRLDIPLADPADVDLLTVALDDASPILAGVGGLKAEALSGGEWLSEYAGPLPDGLRLTLILKNGNEVSHVESVKPF